MTSPSISYHEENSQTARKPIITLIDPVDLTDLIELIDPVDLIDLIDLVEITVLRGETINYSGHAQENAPHTEGVALMLTNRIQGSNEVADRMGVRIFQDNHSKISHQSTEGICNSMLCINKRG